MKRILLYLVLLVALTMASVVAYVSVSGLLRVFSGAGMVGLILFTTIEICKIIATSAIHTYGKKIGWIYSSLLSVGVLITMVITSIGVYGFLSSTYKDSFAKFENAEAQIVLLEKKRSGYQEQLDIFNIEKQSISENINGLSGGLSNNIIQYKDKETGQIITTTSSSTRRALERQLDNAIARQAIINGKTDTLNNNISDIDNKLLETKLANDSASELGPLKYLSDISGKSMDEVMKWLILLLIIIGDPMAVLMVIIFNKIVKDEENETTQHIIEKKNIAIKKEIKLDTAAPKFEVNDDVEIEVIEVIEDSQPKKPEEVNMVKKKVEGINRGFSVKVPVRKKRKNNVIDRVGSNKEFRDGDADTVYFKRRNK